MAATFLPATVFTFRPSRGQRSTITSAIATKRPRRKTSSSSSSAPSSPSGLRLAAAGDAAEETSTSLQCPHFQSCSGCSHELRLDRPDLLMEAEKFFQGVGDGVSNLSFDSGLLWGWRCRAKLAVRGSSSNPMIGLYREGTHDVEDIPFCRAHHPNINHAVELLRKGISISNVEPYDEDCNTGELRYVQLAVTTYDTSLPLDRRYSRGKVQVVLVWNARSENSPATLKADALSAYLWANGGPNSDGHLLHSVWINFQTSSNNIIFGNRWRHLIGERNFWEHIGGVDVSLAPSSFGQANTKAFDSLLRKLQKYVPYGASVVDLYAGAGIIGLSLAVSRKCRSVKCVEINKESKLSFENSLSRLSTSLNGNISWHNADVSTEPMYWLEGSDVIVVDPPRKGLHPSLIESLQKLPHLFKKKNPSSSSYSESKDEKRPWVLRAREACTELNDQDVVDRSQSWPHTLIYVSCGWDSFQKDCLSLLSDRKWRLEGAHAFNFFPGTQSLEILAVFKWGGRTDTTKKKTGKKKTSKKTK